MTMTPASDAKTYDTVVIGAGHNGLVCAAYLAKAGQKVLLLEAADRVGGLAATREFHPGFRCAVAHQVSHFPASLAKELKLTSHGLKPTLKPTLQAPYATGALRVTADQILGCQKVDQAAFKRYQLMMQRFADALAPFWLKTMPRLTYQGLDTLGGFAHIGWRLKRLGQADMREFMRVATLPMRDLMDEFFEDDTLKAVLAWDGLIGSRMAPRSPNNAVLALLYRMATGGSTVSSSVNQLISSLHGAAEAAGARVQVSSPVAQIIVDQNDEGGEQAQSVSGVRLANGDVIRAERVVSSADPQTTFFRLLGVQALEIGFSSRIRRLRCNGLVAKLHLALSDLPRFSGLTDLDGRIILAPGLDAIEFAFDSSKYGELPEHPVLEVSFPSLAEPGLAPAGQHVLSAQVMYVPRQLKQGWSAETRETLITGVMSVLEEYAPGIGQLVMGRELLTPQCLEEQFGVTGGHWHHTEFALDQVLMMRPTYEAAQYQTPVPGLFLCGAGSHPGGDLTGAPGHNAARAILK